MRNLVLGAASLVAIAAAAGVSPDNVFAQAIDGEMRPLAGEYETTVTFVDLDMPGAPPQMADMMSRMMSRTFTYCLTEEDIAEGYRAITNRSARDGTECEYQRFSATGGQIDAQATCNVEGRDFTMVMQGTGSATSSDIRMTMSGDFGMGDGSMTMRSQHERKGACS